MVLFTTKVSVIFIRQYSITEFISNIGFSRPNIHIRDEELLPYLTPQYCGKVIIY